MIKDIPKVTITGAKFYKNESYNANEVTTFSIWNYLTTNSLMRSTTFVTE